MRPSLMYSIGVASGRPRSTTGLCSERIVPNSSRSFTLSSVKSITATAKSTHVHPVSRNETLTRG